MTTSLELAGKLRQCMEETGTTPAALADLCGVKAPSVYDWLTFGRIAKKHLPVLAKHFGRPLSWWLGQEDDEDMLTRDERQLLLLYRQLSGDFQKRLIEDAEHLQRLEKPDQPQKPPEKPKQ